MCPLSAKPVVTFLGFFFLTAQLLPPTNAQTPIFIPVQANRIIYVKQDAGGNGTGTTWANAYTNLQTAIAAAAAGDEIWVARGTYKPTNSNNRSISFPLRNFVEIYGGFTGNESSRSQRNWNRNRTILSGDIGIAGSRTDNSYHVVDASNTSRSAVLDGFTITSGYADGPGGTARKNIGGGIYSSTGNSTLGNLVIYDNFARSDGGGMFSYNSQPSLTNVVISSNLANGSGGGILNDYFSSPTITNGLFYRNRSQYGGGVFNSRFSNPRITNTTFSSNISDFWGAISNNRSSPIVTNSILWNNVAGISNSQIRNENNSTTTVTYSLVQGGYGGTSNINANPLFVDAANGDLRLRRGSPAINSGNNSAISEVTDLAETPESLLALLTWGLMKER